MTASRVQAALASTHKILPRVLRRYGPKRVSQKAETLAEGASVLIDRKFKAGSSAVARTNAIDKDITTLSTPEARLRPPRQLVKAAVTPPNRPGRRNTKVVHEMQKTAIAVCYATAVRYRFDQLLLALGRMGLIGSGQPSDALNLMGEVIFLPQWPPEAPNAGEAYIFENGAFVTWGATQENADALLASLIRTSDPRSESGVSVEFEGYYAPEMEQIGFEVLLEAGVSSFVGSDIQLRPLPTSSASSSSLFSVPVLTRLGVGAMPKGVATNLHDSAPPLSPHMPEENKLPLPRGLDDILVRLAFSAAIVRSTKLAIHEQELESNLIRTARLPRFMMAGLEDELGRRQDALQLFGTTLHGRHQITMGEQNLLDPPEIFWRAREPALQKVYTDSCEALDFHRRLDIQNTRLDYAFDLAQVLLAHSHARTSEESAFRARKLERWMLAIVASAYAIQQLPHPGDRSVRSLLVYWGANRDRLPSWRSPRGSEHDRVYAAHSVLGREQFAEQGPELPPVSHNKSQRNV